MSIDFNEYDAVNVLALPIHRWESRRHYVVDGGFDGELRRVVYSNGTEHGFAQESAEMILELGPILRRVLLAGVKALEDDEQFEAYCSALASGDHDAITAIEAVAP